MPLKRLQSGLLVLVVLVLIDVKGVKRRRMPFKRLQSGLLVLAVLVLFDVKGLKGDGCRKRVLVLFGGKGFSNVSTFLRITLGHLRREATSTDCCPFELKKNS